MSSCHLAPHLPGGSSSAASPGLVLLAAYIGGPRAGGQGKAQRVHVASELPAKWTRLLCGGPAPCSQRVLAPEQTLQPPSPPGSLRVNDSEFLLFALEAHGSVLSLGTTRLRRLGGSDPVSLGRGRGLCVSTHVPFPRILTHAAHDVTAEKHRPANLLRGSSTHGWRRRGHQHGDEHRDEWTSDSDPSSKPWSRVSYDRTSPPGCASETSQPEALVTDRAPSAAPRATAPVGNHEAAFLCLALQG